MSGRWWRAYEEAVDNPKLQRLSGDMFKAWFNLLCIASANDGVLPEIADVAFKIRKTESQARKIILQLIELRLFDEVDPGIVSPHNWNARQYKSDVSTERVKRFRKRQRNVSSAVSETPPETETETETDKSKISRATRIDDDWPKDYEKQFWDEVPLATGKRKALVKLATIRKQRVPWSKVIEGIRNYRHQCSGKDAQFIKHPASWLNAGCWDDEPDKRAPIATEQTPTQTWIGQLDPRWPLLSEGYATKRGKPPSVDKRGGWYFPNEWVQRATQLATQGATQ